jgi:hypothetical protein
VTEVWILAFYIAALSGSLNAANTPVGVGRFLTEEDCELLRTKMAREMARDSWSLPGSRPDKLSDCLRVRFTFPLTTGRP